MFIVKFGVVDLINFNVNLGKLLTYGHIIVKFKINQGNKKGQRPIQPSAGGCTLKLAWAKFITKFINLENPVICEANGDVM